MTLYSCIVLPVAIFFAVLSFKIFKGKTELIHDYHQTNVEDNENYGKEFGKGLGVVSAGILASGIVGLFGDNTVTMLIAIVVLFAGIFAGLYCIYRVQKKYNSGIF